MAPDHAVYIRAVWGWWSRRPFPSVANSLALARAGVTRDTPAPHNVEIVKDARGEPTGVFLERNFVPVLEYTLFRDLPRFKYCDRVESVRLGAHAYAAAGTTSLYEGHGLTPTVIRAYRENAERNALPLRMHAPVSMPSAAFDDKRLIDLFYHYAGPAGGRGRGDDILRVEGINLGGHADATVADIIAAGYPYDQWAGHFYQAMTQRALRQARHRGGPARPAGELRGQPRPRIRAERLRGDRQGGADPRPPLGGDPRQPGERRRRSAA